MSLLTRKDWELLRDKYNVSFSRMHPDLFNLFMEKVYGTKDMDQGETSARGELDDTDAMMIYLARAEPPIRPLDKIKTQAEPPIRPGTKASIQAEPPIRPGLEVSVQAEPPIRPDE